MQGFGYPLRRLRRNLTDHCHFNLMIIQHAEQAGRTLSDQLITHTGIGRGQVDRDIHQAITDHHVIDHLPGTHQRMPIGGHHPETFG
jgi:hypothetical protein